MSEAMLRRPLARSRNRKSIQTVIFAAVGARLLLPHHWRAEPSDL